MSFELQLHRHRYSSCNTPSPTLGIWIYSTRSWCVAEQVTVLFGISVDPPARAVDQVSILEVAGQRFVEGGQGASAADDRQGQDMDVV